jgi:hypothetical protein
MLDCDPQAPPLTPDGRRVLIQEGVEPATHEVMNPRALQSWPWEYQLRVATMAGIVHSWQDEPVPPPPPPDPPDPYLVWRISGDIVLHEPLPSASHVSSALGEAGEFSVHLVCTPEIDNETGPARIVTISNGPVDRNLTISQKANHLEVRLRTIDSDDNGKPYMVVRDVFVPGEQVEITVIHQGRDTVIQDAIYINNILALDRESSPLSWDPGFPLLLGDELGGNGDGVRTWNGHIELVEIRSQAYRPLP